MTTDIKNGPSIMNNQSVKHVTIPMNKYSWLSVCFLEDVIHLAFQFTLFTVKCTLFI